MPSLRSIAVPAVAILIAAAAAFAVTTGVRADAGPPPLPTPGATPVSPELEAGYGLRLQRATLAVQGGLVDVRFTILDTVRAEPVIGHLSRERVKLVDDATGRVLDTRTMTPGRLQPEGRRGLLHAVPQLGRPAAPRQPRRRSRSASSRLDGVTVR